MRWIAAIALVVLAGRVVEAGEETHVSLVPWKVVVAEDPVDAPLTVYWVPASRDELRRSDLLASSELTLFSSRCVAMRIVRFDDRSRLARLKIGAELPVVMLVDKAGRILGRIDSEDGAIAVGEVEDLVREELFRREEAAESALDEARRRAEAGENDAALGIYRALWEQRCLCPRQARDAKRAMKKFRK